MFPVKFLDQLYHKKVKKGNCGERSSTAYVLGAYVLGAYSTTKLQLANDRV